MKVFRNSEHLRHAPAGELHGGEFVPPFENSDRVSIIGDALSSRGFNDFREPVPLDDAALARVHDPDYLKFLESAWTRWRDAGYSGDVLPTMHPVRRMQQRAPRDIDGLAGYYCLATETVITEGTWLAATTATAAAVSAYRAVAAGDRFAFSLGRPPGHHAAIDLYGGYCFLNHAAVVARQAQAEGASRVAILDVDFHHGNGTQDIFYDDPSVLFVSLHGQPEDAFPHFLGYADEQGTGAGDGATLNLPLPPGTTYSVWSHALEQAERAVQTFKADLLIISLGVDTFKGDPISFFRFETEDFLLLGQRIARLGLPTVFVMEGGYAMAELGANVANVLEAAAAQG